MTSHRSRRTAPRELSRDAQRPHKVVIRTGSKRGEWGRFETIEQAAEVAAKLRRHGMFAVIESDDELARKP